MAITNLNQYYSSIGQSLPSVSQRSGLYSQYGLGGGYTGTAQQNASLLQKLMAGGSSASSSPAPASSGGYSQVPSGQSQALSNDPGYGELSGFANANTQQRQDLVNRLGSELTGAYSQYSNDAGLTQAQELLKQLTDAQASQATKLADLPLQVNQQVMGTFANEGQRQGEINTASAPFQAALSKLATILPGASQDVANRQSQVNTRLGLLQEAQARQITGFDKSSENQLAALQDKINRGRQLTDMEFQKALDLQKAKMQYDAQIESARIGAGATAQAAKIQADASKANTAAQIEAALKQAGLQYPGISVTPGQNGTYVGSLPSYLTGGSSSSSTGQSSSGINLQGGNNQVLQGVIDKYK